MLSKVNTKTVAGAAAIAASIYTSFKMIKDEKTSETKFSWSATAKADYERSSTTTKYSDEQKWVSPFRGGRGEANGAFDGNSVANRSHNNNFILKHLFYYIYHNISILLHIIMIFKHSLCYQSMAPLNHVMREFKINL